MARPSIYTPEIIEYICEQLAEGIPLAEICRAPDMPRPGTVRLWMRNDEKINDAIACAREDGEDRITADIRLIARKKGDSTDDVARDKLIIDTDLKLLAKWNPKKYGDRMAFAGDAENPMEMKHSGKIEMTPAETYLAMLNGKS